MKLLAKLYAVLRTDRRRRRRYIFVDVSTIYRHDAGTGIQRVVREVLKRYPSEDLCGGSIVPVFASKRHGYRYCDVLALRPLAEFVQHEKANHRIRPERGDVFFGLDLAAHVLPRRQRQIRQWKAAGVVIYFLVYDILPWRMPEFFTAKGAANFRAWLEVITVVADRAICISADVAADLQAFFDQRANAAIEVHSVRLGADPPAMDSFPDRLDLTHWGIKLPYVLMVGTVEPRKDYSTALNAFELIWATRADDLSLVIVGREGWSSDEFVARLSSHPEIERRLFWLRNISDGELGYLYSHADLLLVTSLGEGFGLPIVEAMHWNIPVLARDLPVFREVTSGYGNFFSDSDPSHLAERIRDARGRRSWTFQRPPVRSWEEAADDIWRLVVA